MAMTLWQHGARAARRSASVIEMASQARDALWLWRFRSRTRQHLARLDAHLLRDIGLDPADRAVEIEKPFWRA